MFSPTAKRKVFFTISCVLVVISLLLIIFKGFNVGIDFTGGNLIQIDMGQTVTSDIEDRVAQIATEQADITDVSIQTTGSTEVIIKTPELENEVSDAIIEAIKAEYSLEQSALMNNEKVSGTVSGRLIGDAVKAILIAVVLMLLYITIRFDFQSGTSAVLALTHDVVIMLGFQSLFGISVNTSFIAAILTILGYSINATIVIFDRIRENGKLMKKASSDEIADDAIRHSYARAINSSITTLFTIGVLYIIGVESIKEFALPIIVGIVSGTYSSLFVAGPFWAWWKGLGAKKPAGAKK